MVTSTEPRVMPNDRYTIKQTCAILTISRKTLAKYTSAGLIVCGQRPNTLQKFYTGKDILRFWRAAL
ncbi:MAG: DNA-binding protein [Bacteroidaceae bacterium]|nr:DNA-binding protein [Bacteroidaceae bacterium]